jgi:hypothetical protein
MFHLWGVMCFAEIDSYLKEFEIEVNSVREIAGENALGKLLFS